MPEALTGRGLWVWYTSNCGGVTGIIATAKRTGCRWVTIKCGDAGNVWDQFTDDLVRAIQAEGIEVYAWAYIYGDNVAGEIEVARQALAKNVNGFIADAEAEYEGKAAAAERYAAAVRDLAGDRVFAYAPIPVIDYHQALPYVQFNQQCDLAMPQFYVKALGGTWNLAHLLEQWQRWGAQWTAAGLKVPPLAPVGQVYDTADASDVRDMEQVAADKEWPAWSYWSMDAANEVCLTAMAEAPTTAAPPVPFTPKEQPQEVAAALDVLWRAAGSDVAAQKAVAAFKVAMGYQAP